MLAERIDSYLEKNEAYFPPEYIHILRDKLMTLEEPRFILIQSMQLKDPKAMLPISILLGWLGVDRFMLGQTSMGMVKLFSLGLCGILTVIDWLNIKKMTKLHNFDKVMMDFG
jgi:TM2 domain-containing membrane protein YozV